MPLEEGGGEGRGKGGKGLVRFAFLFVNRPQTSIADLEKLWYWGKFGEVEEGKEKPYELMGDLREKTKRKNTSNPCGSLYNFPNSKVDPTALTGKFTSEPWKYSRAPTKHCLKSEIYRWIVRAVVWQIDWRMNCTFVWVLFSSIH